MLLGELQTQVQEAEAAKAAAIAQATDLQQQLSDLRVEYELLTNEGEEV
jgi:hypothetical protein